MPKAWCKGWLVCLLSMVTVSVWATPTQSQIDTARNNALRWLLTHQNGDGHWSSSDATAVASTAAVLDALQALSLRAQPYARGISWLSNTQASSVDSLVRQLNALTGAGMSNTRYLNQLTASRNSGLGWGSYAGYDSSFPDTSLSISTILVNMPSYTNTDLDPAVCQILLAQRSDGSWAYARSESTGGTGGAIMPTAYTVLALYAITTTAGRDTSVYCGTGIISLASKITTGVNWILSKKNTDYGFGINGTSSVLETTLAYQALIKIKPTDTSLGPALDYLLSKQNTSDGSWGSNAFQTALVLKILPPPLSPLLDTDHDGIPDVVEALLGTNPTVPDGRSILATGNGNSVTGVTVPIELANPITIGLAFSYTLTPIAGTYPFTWKLVSGVLPPGLLLASTTGVISGIPTTLGSYSFIYSVTDATLSQAQTVGQLDVIPVAPLTAKGDINGDGRVDAADILLAEQMALGLIAPSATQLLLADVAPAGAPDGIIDAADVARIRRKALGLETF